MMPEMCQDRTHDPRMQEPKRCKRLYLLVESRKRTDKHQEEYLNKNPGNGSGKRPRGRRLRGVGKRRRLPVKDGLRSRPERKLIIVRNFYAALNNMKLTCFTRKVIGM